MKKLTLTLTGVLLASSALIAPGLAFAQTAPAPAESPTAQTPAQQAEPDAQDEASVVDEIVVLGRYIPEPNRESSEVAAFLTSEDLERTGDSDAAAALTRVTGLTVVEGRFIYVRGLGERYSSALLNGSPLPSPEPLQRVVPLDLFPANILESVTVQKTYSANFPGEFGGGVIDLQTIDAPSEPFFSLKASVGANTESTGKKGLVYYGSDTDWTSFDDGTRDVPGPLRLAFDSGKQLNNLNYTPAELQRIGHSLVNAPLRLLQRQTTPANFGAEIAGGLSTETDIGTLGAVFVAGYDNSWDQRTAINQSGGFQGDVLEVNSDFVVDSHQNDVQLNFLGALSLATQDHEVKWTNFFVRSTTKEARSEQGLGTNGSVLRNDYTEWFERQLFTTQLAGEHFFMDGALEFDWRAAYAKTTRDSPYETMFPYGLNTDGQFIHNPNNRISFSELDDDVVSGGADVKYTLPLSDAREAVFSVGVASLDNTRDAERRDLQFVSQTALTDAQRQSRVDYLFSDYNINPNQFQLTEITPQNGASAYEGELKVKAVYAMVDAEIIPLVRTTVGVRFEDGQQTVITRDLFGGAAPLAPTEIDEQYYLPSFTATWNFAEDQQLRLGASQTIGRPQFRELAPQAYTDPETNRSFIGNPYLVDTEILNLDARYEWFFARQQYVTAGVFYKDLDKPVEAIVTNTADTQREQSFLNAPQATVMGAEFEVKKYFEFPDNGMSFIANKRWLVQANYTWSDSDVKVNDDDTVLVLSNGTTPAPASRYIEDGSRLQGQSEHVANLQLGWEDDQARSQATIIVNYVSERITARGAGTVGSREPDLLQDPGVFVDFVYRKDFTLTGRDLGFSLELRNLLGTEFDEYQELGNKILVNNYDLGSSATISLTARF